jgi:hypothetical protein
MLKLQSSSLGKLSSFVIIGFIVFCKKRQNTVFLLEAPQNLASLWYIRGEAARPKLKGLQKKEKTHVSGCCALSDDPVGSRHSGAVPALAVPWQLAPPAGKSRGCACAGEEHHQDPAGGDNWYPGSP